MQCYTYGIYYPGEKHAVLYLWYILPRRETCSAIPMVYITQVKNMQCYTYGIYYPGEKHAVLYLWYILPR